MPETFVKSVTKGLPFPNPLSPGQAGWLSVQSLEGSECGPHTLLCWVTGSEGLSIGYLKSRQDCCRSCDGEKHLE